MQENFSEMTKLMMIKMAGDLEYFDKAEKEKNKIQYNTLMTALTYEYEYTPTKKITILKKQPDKINTPLIEASHKQLMNSLNVNDKTDFYSACVAYIEKAKEIKQGKPKKFSTPWSCRPAIFTKLYQFWLPKWQFFIPSSDWIKIQSTTENHVSIKTSFRLILLILLTVLAALSGVGLGIAAGASGGSIIIGIMLSLLGGTVGFVCGPLVLSSIGIGLLLPFTALSFALGSIAKAGAAFIEGICKTVNFFNRTHLKSQALENLYYTNYDAIHSEIAAVEINRMLQGQYESDTAKIVRANCQGYHIEDHLRPKLPLKEGPPDTNTHSKTPNNPAVSRDISALILRFSDGQNQTTSLPNDPETLPSPKK